MERSFDNQKEREIEKRRNGKNKNQICIGLDLERHVRKKAEKYARAWQISACIA